MIARGMGRTSQTRDLALAFAAMLCIVVALSSSKEMVANLHTCLWKGPKQLADASVGFAGTDKRRAMNDTPCALHGWMLAHVLGYGALAFLFPEQWLVIFGVGAAWEVYEIFVRVFQPLDFLWNGVGIAAGVALSRLIH